MTDILELGKKRAEELGLKPSPFQTHMAYMVGGGGTGGGSSSTYYADDIHRLLGGGQIVFTDCTTENYWGPLDDEGRDKHQALLIGVRPIKQESEERQLLRELVNKTGSYAGHNTIRIPIDLYDRAKALLSRKGEG